MRWALAWALYWLGDLVERWNDNDRRFTEAGFNLYQYLMRASDAVQGSSANGPWSAAQVDRNPEGHDPEEGHGAKHESPVAATGGDAPDLSSCSGGMK